MSDDKPENTMVAALLRERESLVLRGLDDRVAQVDQQLEFHGYKPTGDDTRTAAPKDAKTPRRAQQQTREGA